MIRRLFWLAFLVAFAWFGMTVPLGKRTLFGHLVAIWATPEAQDLKRGATEEAEKVADEVRAGLRADAGSPAPAGTHEVIDDKDRRDLRKLVEERQSRAGAPRQ